MSITQNAAFTLTRQPIELRRRRVRVARVDAVTPTYRRIEFTGDDLRGFISLGAGDHVRVFFPPEGWGADPSSLAPTPDAGDALPAGWETREYTPVAWDGVSTLTIDFVLHPGGVATRWAASAGVGDELMIGGPRGSRVLEGRPDWWLLAGDLTALPAIRRHAATAAHGVRVDVVVLVDDPADRQEIASPGDLHVRWVHPPASSAPGDVTPLLAALHEVPVSEGDGFAFVAAEQSVMAPARALLEARGADLSRCVVKGYWKRGVAEYHAPRDSAA